MVAMTSIMQFGLSASDACTVEGGGYSFGPRPGPSATRPFAITLFERVSTAQLVVHGVVGNYLPFGVVRVLNAGPNGLVTLATCIRDGALCCATATNP
jgi:hypothetical protein